MITLCMDTSHIFLALALIKDDQLLDSVQKKCWKQQSEEIFPELMAMMERQHLATEDIDQIVVTEGPGSYTGVRIAMTIGKVFCVMRDLPLYTVGTLQLYCGSRHARCVLDARGGRVYTAVLKDGEYEEKPHIVMVDDLKDQIDSLELVGDGHLFGREDYYPDLAQNFLALKDRWVKAANTNLVKPEYLKPSTAYLVK